MSMTIYSKLQGVTDIGLLREAIQSMGFAVRESADSPRGRSVKKEVAKTMIYNREIRIVKNSSSGELELVGDSDWRFLRDSSFKNKVRQQYSVAAVKKKVRAMKYQVSSVTTQEDGTIRLLATSWG